MDKDQNSKIRQPESKSDVERVLAILSTIADMCSKSEEQRTEIDEDLARKHDELIGDILILCDKASSGVDVG